MVADKDIIAQLFCFGKELAGNLGVVDLVSSKGLKPLVNKWNTLINRLRRCKGDDKWYIMVVW